MNIAAQVKLLRRVKGETLSDVADGTGLSLSYLSDIERGRTLPTIETLERIAAYHGLQLVIDFVGNAPGVVQMDRKALTDVIQQLQALAGDEQ